jgi:hypothetical protein
MQHDRAQDEGISDANPDHAAVDHQWGLATYHTRSTKTPGTTGP